MFIPQSLLLPTAEMDIISIEQAFKNALKMLSSYSQCEFHVYLLDKAR